VTPEERQFDVNNFNTAIDKVPELRIQRSTRNLEILRGYACLALSLPTFVPYPTEVFASAIVACNQDLEKEPPPAPKKELKFGPNRFEGDSAGEVRNNLKSGYQEINVGEAVTALQQRNRVRESEQGLKELALQERLRLISPEEAAKKRQELSQIPGTFSSSPSRSAFVQLPLDIANGSEELKSASPAQLKDLLARRRRAKEAGGVR
jgi:hypothetical protein